MKVSQSATLSTKQLNERARIGALQTRLRVARKVNAALHTLAQ